MVSGRVRGVAFADASDGIRGAVVRVAEKPGPVDRHTGCVTAVRYALVSALRSFSTALVQHDAAAVEVPADRP
jgi:hypothetical protein